MLLDRIAWLFFQLLLNWGGGDDGDLGKKELLTAHGLEKP
jgi:hypothetical protein